MCGFIKAQLDSPTKKTLETLERDKYLLCLVCVILVTFITHHSRLFRYLLFHNYNYIFIHLQKYLYFLQQYFFLLFYFYLYLCISILILMCSVAIRSMTVVRLLASVSVVLPTKTGIKNWLDNCFFPEDEDDSGDNKASALSFKERRREAHTQVNIYVQNTQVAMVNTFMLFGKRLLSLLGGIQKGLDFSLCFLLFLK